MTIGSGVRLKSAVMTHMVHFRTFLWSWKRFCSGYRPDHKLITGLVHHPLVSHILLLLTLSLLHNKSNYNRLFSFTNFTSLEIFTVELLSPVYTNPVLSKKVFWEERTSSSFFVYTRSTLAFAWTTPCSRNLTLV